MLQKACVQDIPKFCKDVIIDEENDQELEGKVINCLKKQYATRVSVLDKMAVKIKFKKPASIVLFTTQ